MSELKKILEKSPGAISVVFNEEKPDREDWLDNMQEFFKCIEFVAAEKGFSLAGIDKELMLKIQTKEKERTKKIHADAKKMADEAIKQAENQRIETDKQ